MRKELQYFYIEHSYGGNQDWFLNYMMRVGGCAAETWCDSCVYFAKYYGMAQLYPFRSDEVAKSDYVAFSRKIEPYLKPRMQGINTLEIYLNGVRSYLDDIGESRLTLEPLSGSRPWQEAAAALTAQIDEGCPVPCLVLYHKSPSLRDYVWHWFLLIGYESFEDSFMVKAVTYGNYEWLDFKELWDSGYRKKGGLILFHVDQETVRTV